MRWTRHVQKFMTRPWMVPLIVLGAGLDAFVWIIPIDALLIARVLVSRKRWWLNALFVALGSAIGATILALLIEHNASSISYWIERQMSPDDWRKAKHILGEWGGWGLAFVSVGPLPQQPAIIVEAMGGAPARLVFFSVLGARIIKYECFAALAALAPHWLMKVSFIRKGLEKLQPDNRQAA